MPLDPEAPILHRHADGTEHSHGGRKGFAIGGQVIYDDWGDNRHHSHSTISLVGTSSEPRPSSGDVVWSERDADGFVCDECHEQINGEMQSPEHDNSCSLHPRNEVKR